MLRNSDWTSDGCSSDLATATGRAIVRASADNLARVTLELGGKSPAIVLPDAELDLAIPGIANGIFGNGGQVCVANSRVYAHEDIFDALRSEEHTSELQSLMRISYAVFCLQKKKNKSNRYNTDMCVTH